LRAIKYVSKAELRRAIESVITFQGNDRLFYDEYDNADYHFFERLFKKTILNKNKS